MLGEHTQCSLNTSVKCEGFSEGLASITGISEKMYSIAMCFRRASSICLCTNSKLGASKNDRVTEKKKSRVSVVLADFHIAFYIKKFNLLPRNANFLFLPDEKARACVDTQ